MNRQQKNGRHPRDGARSAFIGLMAMGLFFTSSLFADELDDLLVYAKAGAPHLTIKLIEQRQPDQQTNLQGWLRWERALIGLLRDNQEWATLEQRVVRQGDSLPLEHRRWMSTQRAEALLNLQRPQEARSLLRSLLWSDSEALTADISRWRQLIIQSYLHEGRHDDAYDAMLRHRQDYGDGDRETLLLRARVLLTNGRPMDAKLQLKGAGEGADAASLRLLAGLRAGESVKVVVQEAKRRLKENPASVRARFILLGVVAEGSAQLGDLAATIVALEQYYGETGYEKLETGLLHISPDTLWQSYVTYGIEVGNREQLLLGDDPAWLKAAEVAGRQYPVRSRSLYAVLSERASTADNRLRAHRALLQQLAGKERKSMLIKALYLQSTRFNQDARLPEPVRYFLYDSALNEGNLELASRMRQGLATTPADMEPFDWQLRGARVYMLAGDYEHAMQTLVDLSKAPAPMSSEQFDRIMQVLFDMQTVGEHERAVKVFEQLAQRPMEVQTRRELLYWIGDSRYAQQRYLEAARYYLHSAILPGVDSMDPWAETARYQTAKALTLAGQGEDAATLYRQLLKVTTDPARRAVLQRELEQLRLVTKK
jgi:hypothetical protein